MKLLIDMNLSPAWASVLEDAELAKREAKVYWVAIGKEKELTIGR